MNKFKYITKCLFSVYQLSYKKKFDNIPNTFYIFIEQNIEKGLCPKQCIDYVHCFIN